jgi:hypothetical protein
MASKKTAAKSTKHNPDSFPVYASGEDESISLARAMLDPAAASMLAQRGFVAATAQSMNAPAVSVTGLVDTLNASMKQVEAGDLTSMERMLVGQANALQSMFVEFSRRGALQMGHSHEALETYMRLAFRAQSQSRAAVEALVELKFPRTTVIAKQANVNNGGQQQVNNGVPVPAQTAQAVDAEKSESKLLEHSNAREWMDTGTSPASERSNKEMETVGALHRA